MLTPVQVLDHYFLDMRCMLLEIAATLDRYDRAAQSGNDGAPISEERLEKVYQSLALLSEAVPEANRSERLLQLFSDLD